MTNSVYRDVWIENGDVVLDAGRNPIIITDAACIAQDIKHAILESGLAVELVAERSPTEISDIEYRIIMLAEMDIRIVPGTADITLQEDGRLLSASTYEFGDIKTWL